MDLCVRMTERELQMATKKKKNTAVIIVQVLETPTELNAPVQPDESELTLIERIRSIKEQKWAEIPLHVLSCYWAFKIKSWKKKKIFLCSVIFRVEVAYGLTDMEHDEHSDSEILDDDSSMSTESLDRLGSLDSEGQ